MITESILSLTVYVVLCVLLYIWVKMYVNILSIHVDEAFGICMCGNLRGMLHAERLRS